MLNKMNKATRAWHGTKWTPFAVEFFSNQSWVSTSLCLSLYLSPSLWVRIGFCDTAPVRS